MESLLCGNEVDRRLKWPVGRADRLAGRGRLPHIRLPDGAIRFEWPEIERLMVRVDLAFAEGQLIRGTDLVGKVADARTEGER